MLLKYLMYVSTVFYYDGLSKVILEFIESQDMVGDILIRQKRSIVAIRILTDMEFDLSKIHFYTEDRRNKYPSPICFSV